VGLADRINDWPAILSGGLGDNTQQRIGKSVTTVAESKHSKGII